MPITRKLNGRGVAISVPARNRKTKAAVDVHELEPIRPNVDEVPTARRMGITCELERYSVVIGVPARNGKTKAAIHVFDLNDIAAHGGKAPGTRRITVARELDDFVVDVLVSSSGAQAQVAVGVHDLHSAAGSGGRGNAQAKNNGWDREGSNQPDCSSAHGYLCCELIWGIALIVASLTLGPNTWTAAHAKNGQHWRSVEELPQLSGYHQYQASCVIGGMRYQSFDSAV
jgi:hypothetical protein